MGILLTCLETTAVTQRYTTDAGAEVGQVAYIGLRKFVVSTCMDATNSDWKAWKGCSQEAVWWSAATCTDGQTDYYGFPCSAVRLSCLLMDACA